MRAKLDRVLLDSLPVVCFALAAVYLLLGVSHLVVLPDEYRVKLAGLAGSSAVALAALGALLLRISIPPRWAHPLGSCVVWIVVGNSLAHLHFAAVGEHSVNILLALVGAACFFTSRSWYVAVLLGVIMAWVGVARWSVPDFDWTHHAFSLFLTTLLAFLILESRRRSLRDFIDLTDLERDRSNRLSAIVDASMDAMLSVDHEGRITGFNPAAESIFGYSADEIRGQRLGDLLVPESLREKHRIGFERYVETRRPTILNTRVALTGLRRNGEEFPLELVVQDVSAADAPPAFVGYVRDTTETREIEENLRAATAAAELHSRAKSEFLARMSHEIRTPLNAILGMTDLILADDLSHKQRDFAERAQSAAEYLLAVLGDLLDLSKIEAGRLELEITSFSLWELLEDALRDLEVRAAQKGLEIVLDLGIDVPEQLRGDPIRIRQVITNLVGNAIKFTERGCIRVAVEVESADGLGSTLRFCVEDTGPGIPEEIRSSLFQEFVQGAGHQKRSGAGLGLAISSRLVDLMGGRIWLEDLEGGGSRFVFTARLESTGTRRGSDGDALRGKQVAVFSAAPLFQQALDRLLRALGADVELFDDASALATRLGAPSREDLDLLVVDAGHARKTRHALAGEVEEILDRPGPPIILVEDWLLPGERRETLASARILRAVKPLGPAQVLELSREAFGETKGETGPHRGAASYGAPEPDRSLRLLVVEDNETNRLLLFEMLQRRGHHVHMVASARSALDCFASQPFDAILMDLQLPDMDGMNAASRIREMEAGRGGHTPIIAVTASATPEIRDRVLSGVFDGFVPKPIRIERLMGTLWSLVGATPSSLGPSEPETEAGDGEIVDEERLLEHVVGDAELLSRLTALFLESCPADLEALGSAVRTADHPEVRRLAHKLQGSLGDLAAIAATAAVEKLGACAKSGDAAGLRSAYEEVLAEIRRLSAALPRIAQRHQKTAED